MRSLRLTVVEGEFAVWRLDPVEPMPSLGMGSLVSVTRTEDELSIVSRSTEVAAGATAESGWRCLRVEGPMAFDETGVLADLSAPLARAEIPIFVISTYDTDYLLVKAADFDRACSTLSDEGHSINVGTFQR